MQEKIQIHISKANDFDLRKVISRYARDHSVDLDTASRLAEELKKWLVLCSVNRDADYQLVGPVDDMWHTFLLYTKEYSEFSKVIGSYVHHVPFDPDAVKATERDKSAADELNDVVERGYNDFLSDYREVFEEVPPPAFWPEFSDPFGARKDPAGGGCGRGCGCTGAHPL